MKSLEPCCESVCTEAGRCVIVDQHMMEINKIAIIGQLAGFTYGKVLNDISAVIPDATNVHEWDCPLGKHDCLQNELLNIVEENREKYGNSQNAEEVPPSYHDKEVEELVNKLFGG